ncbi:metal-dependent hydrolase [Natrarchaeobius halalkaliphilus]|uniref:Metal-dependent hydrolase n=1 Tax=Natrarchaeobius halalkaliphilus TaxID=1679091 RepID=A0A3N6LWE9_9EURY|nr:metal-dependent hydrolase [Natrarchaeobius halalkaliphilus]RQG93167.1 metal-dependent hydrolase [Natrarchaeobius halalkaliphilus]
MQQTGHYGAALVAYAPVGFVVAVLLSAELAAVSGFVAIGLSVLPDVDMKTARIAHRGVTHTVHFAVLVGVILGLTGILVGVQTNFGAPFVLGSLGLVIGTIAVASHIAVDALTPMGVDPLFTGNRYSLSVTTAADPVANYALFCLGVTAIVLAAGLASVVVA